MRWSASEKGRKTENDHWIVTCSMQWTWRSEVPKPVTQGCPELASHRVNANLFKPSRQSFDPTKRNSCDRPFLGIYRRYGVCPSASRIPNDHFGVTPGMCSLGHR